LENGHQEKRFSYLDGDGVTEEERKHIGWTEREEGYYKLYAPPKGSIVTHAFILCRYCGGAIYHCMGPRYDAVCLTCFEKDIEVR
jgi:hypothetical protein